LLNPFANELSERPIAFTPGNQVPVLDHYEIAGVVATWWDKSETNFKTLEAQNFDGLLDSWITTLPTVLEPEVEDYRACNETACLTKSGTLYKQKGI